MMRVELLGFFQIVGIQRASGEGGIRTLEVSPSRSTKGNVSIGKAEGMNRSQWEQFMLPCDAALGHWFAGFVDGEGCFSISRAPIGFRVELIIKLRADDRAILEQLVTDLGIGSLHTGKHSGPAVNGKPWVRWTVRRRRDLIRVTEILDAFPLRTKKARDYALWREAAIEWAIGSQPMNWEPIEQAFHALRDVREYTEIVA